MPSLKPFFPVGLSGHFQPDRLLDNPVGDCVTQDGVGENFAPVLLGKLGREDRREAFDPTIYEIIHILHMLGSQGAKPEIVQNQDRHGRQLFQEVKRPALSPGERELFKETVDREEERREALTAGGQSQSAGKMGFPDSGGTGNEDVFPLAYEVSRLELPDPGSVELTGNGKVEILEGGRHGEGRLPESSGQTGVLAVEPFIFKTEIQELRGTPVLFVEFLKPSGKGLPKAVKFEVAQKFGGGVDQGHEQSPWVQMTGLVVFQADSREVFVSA